MEDFKDDKEAVAGRSVIAHDRSVIAHDLFSVVKFLAGSVKNPVRDITILESLAEGDKSNKELRELLEINSDNISSIIGKYTHMDLILSYRKSGKTFYRLTPLEFAAWVNKTFVLPIDKLTRTG